MPSFYVDRSAFSAGNPAECEYIQAAESLVRDYRSQGLNEATEELISGQILASRFVPPLTPRQHELRISSEMIYIAGIADYCLRNRVLYARSEFFVHLQLIFHGDSDDSFEGTLFELSPNLLPCDPPTRHTISKRVEERIVELYAQADVVASQLLKEVESRDDAPKSRNRRPGRSKTRRKSNKNGRNKKPRSTEKSEESPPSLRRENDPEKSGNNSDAECSTGPSTSSDSVRSAGNENSKRLHVHTSKAHRGSGYSASPTTSLDDNSDCENDIVDWKMVQKRKPSRTLSVPPPRQQKLAVSPIKVDARRKRSVDSDKLVIADAPKSLDWTCAEVAVDVSPRSDSGTFGTTSDTTDHFEETLVCPATETVSSEPCELCHDATKDAFVDLVVSEPVVSLVGESSDVGVTASDDNNDNEGKVDVSNEGKENENVFFDQQDQRSREEEPSAGSESLNYEIGPHQALEMEQQLTMLQLKVRQLEMQVAIRDEQLLQERRTAAKTMQMEKDVASEQILALQLRLYISDTRLKAYEEALSQHIASVTENVAGASPAREVPIPQTGSPLYRRGCK
jgi:hypothetical protein